MRLLTLLMRLTCLINTRESGLVCNDIRPITDSVVYQYTITLLNDKPQQVTNTKKPGHKSFLLKQV